MIDIVHRLRRLYEFCDGSLDPYKTCGEAADEIEELRKLQVGLTCAEDEIVRLRNLVEANDTDIETLKEDCNEYWREIERLRGLLRETRQYVFDAGTDENPTLLSEIDKAIAHD